jgi:hypothetical protein
MIDLGIVPAPGAKHRVPNDTIRIHPERPPIGHPRPESGRGETEEEPKDAEWFERLDEEEDS